MDTTVDLDLIKIRRALHAKPELSGQEYQTAKTIVALLTPLRPSVLLEGLGGTGVLAIFDSGKSGMTLLFRSELDALPIQEINDFDYRSQIDNVAHKCGHDGHSTILLGLAKKLSQQPPSKGKVVLLFQPAEETGQGAEAVLEDPKFASIKPDFVFAFHNLPGYPLHQVLLKKGSFTAAVKSIIIKLHGKTAHAAEPEHGINPALAIAELIQQSQLLSNNQPEKANFAVLTPIHINLGKKAYGISAGDGELHLTIRTWTEQEMENLIKSLLEIISSVADKYHLRAQVEWTHRFRANQNDDLAVDCIYQAAKECNLQVVEKNIPFKWGEDFGLFTQHFRGAMFGIGAGIDTPALHNPDYDFPDEILPTGVNLFYNILSKILGQ